LEPFEVESLVESDERRSNDFRDGHDQISDVGAEETEGEECLRAGPALALPPHNP
jgi:hypothetical protein